MATTIIGDYKQYASGSYSAYIAPFGAGSLVSGTDFTESDTITNGAFPNQTTMTWSWPSTPPASGVRDFNAVDFGDYDNTTVPVPVPSEQISKIGTLTETHSLSFSGDLQGFDAIDDMFLTTAAGSNSPHAFEVEVFLHTPSNSALYVQDSKPIGTFTSGGINWTVAEATGGSNPDILVMPSNQADVASGTVDLKAMLDYMVTQGVVPGTDYFNGFALGTETRFGSGSMTINNMAVNYSTATTPAPTPTPTPVPTPSPKPSANDTILAAGATGSIIDASHNTWTIANGVVDENGAAAGYSTHVSEIAYVGSTIWQENTSNLWWSWSGTGWTGGSGSATSPLPATSTPTPTPVPTPTVNADTLSLVLSEDQWNGNAQFIVKGDGKQIGGPTTVTALHNIGATQTFSYAGNWGTGVNVEIDFINDAYGGTVSTDRNLYVDQVKYNGSAAMTSPHEMYSNGAFTLFAGH